MRLVPVKEEHADALYALLVNSSVTDTLLWDGPASLDDLRASLREREERTARGEMHQFTIVDSDSGQPIGSADVRVDGIVAEIGLWIGEPFHGKGIGTEVVRELTRYAFERLPIERIKADVFVGNDASRRVFEKCGYRVEGIAPAALQKRGKAIDVWRMAITSDGWRESANGPD